jgi:hypothetical protein
VFNPWLKVEKLIMREPLPMWKRSQFVPCHQIWRNIFFQVGQHHPHSEARQMPMLLDCTSRGLETEPSLAMGDGDLGF